jgi:hypothetical protein
MVETMKVYIVWFPHCGDRDDLIGIFETEEGAKAYIKSHSTYGNEGLYWEEQEVAA